MPTTLPKRLTDTYLRNFKDWPEKESEIHDGECRGLFIRARAAGSLTFYVSFPRPWTPGARPGKFAIGRYPDVSLSEARKRAPEIRQMAREGIDPNANKKVEMEKKAREMAAAKRPAEDSAAALADLFVSRYVNRQLKPSTARNYRAHFDLYIKPAWGDRKVSELKRADVAALLDKIEDRAPTQCNRLQATISKWFNWLVNERGILEYSPIVGMKKRSKEIARDRVLNDDELRLIWKACEQKGWPFGQMDQLLLLTTKRRGEVAGMRWSEIDWDEGLWRIPGERTKNKREDVVPLSRFALELLSRLPKLADEDLVFPAANGSGNPVSGFSKAKKKMDELSGVAEWRLHDLRRTVRSNLTALNIRKEVADKVLHHVDQTVDGIHYDHHDYIDQKRDALQAWANKLKQILDPDSSEGNVVELKRS